MENDNSTIKVKNEFNSDNFMYELYAFMGEPEVLKDSFYSSDLPILYEDLLIYPVTMEFYSMFNILANCLTLHKNLSGDIKAIQMSYLDYLFYLAEQGKEMYAMFLEKLLLLVLRKELYARGENGDIITAPNGEPIRNVEFIYRDKRWTINILREEITFDTDNFVDDNYDIYDGDDFIKIREIICEQNNIELLGDEVHPDKIKKIEEWEEVQRQKNKDKICTVEERKAIMKVIKGWSTKQVDSMTIRDFAIEYDRFSILQDYNLMTILSPNLEEKSRKKILSWDGKLPKQSKLERIMSDYEKFNNQFKINKK